MTMSPPELADRLGSGLLSFPITHLHADQTFDERGYRNHIEWLSQFDVACLFAAGGTGELFSLTPVEVAWLVAAAAGAATLDRIDRVKLSSITLPLKNPISDAKVLTGRQKPMTEVAFLFAEIHTATGHSGIGFSYSKRAGGPAQFAHAREVAPALLGEDPNDIAKIWTKLV